MKVEVVEEESESEEEQSASGREVDTALHVLGARLSRALATVEEQGEGGSGTLPAETNISTTRKG